MGPIVATSVGLKDKKSRTAHGDETEHSNPRKELERQLLVGRQRILSCWA